MLSQRIKQSSPNDGIPLRHQKRTRHWATKVSVIHDELLKRSEIWAKPNVRAIDRTRRLAKRRSGSFISSNAGSGATFLSEDTVGGTARPAGSVVVVPPPSGGPEEIQVVDDELELETRGRPRKRLFRRLSKKKRPERKGLALPSTSELMAGVAPDPSVADDHTIRERVREAMSVAPRTASPQPSFMSMTPGAGPSRLIESPFPPAPTSVHPGTLSSYTRSLAKAATPPLSRQTPRLTHMNMTSAPSLAPSKARSASSRRIAVREVTGGTRAPSEMDAHSIAAINHATRPPKHTRIFEVAEVIPGERPLSVVSEEPAEVRLADQHENDNADPSLDPC